MDDGLSAILIACTLGGVGLAIVRLARRLSHLEDALQRWAIGLGIVSGFVFFFGTADRRDLRESLITSALFGGLAAFPWFFVLAILALAYHYIVSPPFRMLGYIKRRVGDRWAWRREDKRRRRQQKESECMAPIHERTRQAAEAQKAVAQKRREDARLHCELLYNRHVRELGSAFPRDQLAEFMKRYMSDTHAPEFVEERGRLLEEMIRESLGPSKERTKFSNLKELADYFENRRKEVDALPYPDEVKDTYRIQINQEEDKALRRFLQP